MKSRHPYTSTLRHVSYYKLNMTVNRGEGISATWSDVTVKWNLIRSSFTPDDCCCHSRAPLPATTWNLYHTRMTLLIKAHTRGDEPGRCNSSRARRRKLWDVGRLATMVRRGGVTEGQEVWPHWVVHVMSDTDATEDENSISLKLLQTTFPGKSNCIHESKRESIDVSIGFYHHNQTL